VNANLLLTAKVKFDTYLKLLVGQEAIKDIRWI